MIVLTILRLIILLLSWLGCCAAVEKKYNIHASYLPMLVMSGQICLLFLAGLLNLMLPMTVLLLLVGVVLFVRGLRAQGSAYLRSFCSPAYICFFLMAAILFVTLQGRRLSVYDDFSHWGLVVKQMLMHNRYPNFTDTILFQAYPLGSSTFVYYVARIIGGGEENWLYAQGLLYLVFLLPLFRFSGERVSLAGWVYVFGFAYMAMVYIIPCRSSLCVDGLLAAVAAGALIYTWDVCRERSDRMKGALLWCIPLLCTCILIKNSGLLFAVLGSALLLKNAMDKKLEPVLRKRSAWIALVPYLSLLLWQRHCALVYENAVATKHALSVAYLSYMFRNKPVDYLIWLAKRIILFSAEGLEVYLVLAFLLGTGVVLYLCAPARMRDYGKLLLSCAAFYALYLFGMYLTYAFSMTVDQGYVLTSGDRYRRTALLIILIFVGVVNMYALSQPCGKTRKVGGILLAAALLLGIWMGNAEWKKAMLACEKGNARTKLEQVLQKHPLPRGESFLIVNSSNGESGIELFLGPYLTLTKEVMLIVDAEQEQMNDSIKAYHHLVILDDDNPAVQEWIAREYPEQAGQEVIDLWRGEDSPPPEAEGYPRLTNFISKLY